MKLKIGHTRYVIRTMSDDDEAEGIANGYVLPDKGLIVVSATVPATRQLETLLHEIIHAGLHEYGHASWNDEAVVGPLGCALAAIILDNKGLLPVLMALREGAGFLEGSK